MSRTALRPAGRTDVNFRRSVEVRLLPKIAARQEFKLLRPICLLCTRCKSFSRTLLHKAGERDAGEHRTRRADPAMQGFRNGLQRAEMIQTLRALTEKATEWQVPMCACVCISNPFCESI